MRLTLKQKTSSVIAASAVGALALVGGTYAAFTAQDTADGQVISSGSSALVFTDEVTSATFGATYSNLVPGDSEVSYIDLTNSGSTALAGIRISQASGGDPLALGAEGPSVQIDRVDFGANAALGGGDDTVTPAVANDKLALLLNKLLLPAPVAPAETAHLKFTVTIDPAAVTQFQQLSTQYTVISP